MTTVYRERDRYDDSRSVASTRRDDGDRTYTKVTRYVVREDDDTRSNYTASRRQDSRQDSPERETIRITRRVDSPERESRTIRITRRDVDDRESVASPRQGVPSYVERDMSIRGGRDEGTRASRAWERTEDTTDKEIVIRRTEEHDEGRRETDRESLAVTKIDDRRDSQRYDYDNYRSNDGRDRDLQHYSRTAEYYAPQQPQTIIIRQDPIIIRERVRDDDYQMVRRSEAEEERSVATTRRDEPRDEEYFYEKKVREYDRRNDDFERRSRREISPHDSISQVGRRDQGYSSDDSMVYVKRVEKRTSSRSSSGDNKKDLAAGVIAGVGAAELLRNHNKKEGKETSHGIGRIGRDVGAGAVGALAAEGIRRYRSKSRRGSRERDRSESRDRYGYRRDRDRGRSRSRSRSGSRSNLKTLGALGLGAVAIAAAASVASRKRNENKKEERRSRSRRRHSSRSSVESLSDLENDPKAEDSRNPKRRNQRIAAAGAVGAAGAALLDRARSKSRGAEGSRERSRIRQGLPIAAAGLGTAALAGLYEKNKAKREAEALQKEQKRSSRSRSGTRGSAGRSDSYYDDRPRSADPAWGVEYGHGDVSGNNYGPEYYGRGPPPEPYYSNETAVVPAGRTRSRSRSLSRDRRGTRSVSPGRASAAGLGAGAGAIAATEHERRKAEKRERKARKRAQEAQEAGQDPYEDAYAPQSAPPPPLPAWTPPPPNDPYANQQGFGAQYQSQFPPPPGSMPQGMPNQFQPQYAHAPAPAPTPQPGPYTPQSYTPQPPYQTPFQAPNYSTPQPGMPPQQQGYHHQYNPAGGPSYGQQPQYRGTPDENVSAGSPFPPYVPPTPDQRPFDGVNNTRSLDPTPGPPIPPAPTPAIQVHPPANTSSNPSLDIPHSYIPPGERPDTPTDDNSGNDRRVQFAGANRSPSVNQNNQHQSDAVDSDDISPDARRQRRRQHESNRGYEAGDDTDLSPNTERRASKHGSNRDSSRDRGNSSRKERTSDRSLNPEDNNYGRRRSRRSSRSSNPGDRDQSPGSDSDATIDLPARFDEKGRKKPEKGDDPLADRIDDILKGKGTAGKVFGNFMDGLFGPEGKNKGGSDAGEGGSKRRRDRDRE